jgi:hypothetical protein
MAVTLDLTCHGLTRITALDGEAFYKATNLLSGDTDRKPHGIVRVLYEIEKNIVPL